MAAFFTPDELIVKLQDRVFQEQMIDWVKCVLRPLENNAIYLMVVKNRPVHIRPIDTACLDTILKIWGPYIQRGTPAHEKGHHIFDGLGGAGIISNDPFIATAYRNEIDAAFLGALGHDIATGVQHRYIDNLWELDHGEIGAWIAYHSLKDLISEPVRRLMAYSIAAHPHKYTKTGDLVSYRWEDLLFFDGDVPVRLAVWITRWTDRLENGADSGCHAVRHALANVDGARVKVKRSDGSQAVSTDLHGVDWYSFSDSLKYIFTPRLGVTEICAPDGSVSKIPSMLQHLHGYAASALAKPYSVYNQHDDRSPNMRTLMDWKVNNSAKFIDLVVNTIGEPNFNTFIELMRMKSGYPNNQLTTDTISMVEDLWKLNSAGDQAHWAQGFDFAHKSYFEWINYLQNQILKATDPLIVAFQPLVPELISQVTQS